VHRGYGGLDLERSGLVAAKASTHELVTFDDQCLCLLYTSRCV